MTYSENADAAAVPHAHANPMIIKLNNTDILLDNNINVRYVIKRCYELHSDSHLRPLCSPRFASVRRRTASLASLVRRPPANGEVDP